MEIRTVRAASWNVMGTGDASSLRRRAGSVAETVSQLSCDVLLLQEAWEGALERIQEVAGLQLAAAAGYLDERRLCAVMCRSEILPPPDDARTLTLTLPGSQSGSDYLAVAAQVSVHGSVWGVASAHMPWGGLSERARIDAAVSLDSALGDVWSYGRVPVLLGADMNSLPSSSSWRTLCGLEAHDARGAFWVDAFAEVGSGPGFTAGPAVAPLAAETASGFPGVLHADMEPSRRIDGLFSRGWCFGRAGGPVSASVVSSGLARASSDHLPLLAELLAG